MPAAKPQPHRVSLGTSASAPIFGQDEPQEPVSMSLRQNHSASMGPSKSTSQLLPSASVGLYASPSFSSMYAEVEDLEPGPGSYDLPQSFGYQQLSQHMSQPCSSLTAKHDKSWAKVWISKDHLSSFMARGSPGPGTYQPELLSKESRIRFGTSTRKPLSDSNFRAPGPVYDLPSSVEPPKSVKFSKANRFDVDNQSLSKLLGSTGPGQYEVPGSFDNQRLAKSFGASHRAYDRVRFPGSDRVGIGRQSPGPGSLQPFQNAGKGVSFGRAERLPGNNADKRAPGPGAYDNHERGLPASRNQSCYSFGRPPAKARVDFKLMLHPPNPWKESW